MYIKILEFSRGFLFMVVVSLLPGKKTKGKTKQPFGFFLNLYGYTDADTAHL